MQQDFFSLFETPKPKPELIALAVRKGYQVAAKLDGEWIATYLEAATPDELKNRLEGEFPADEGYTEHTYQET